MPDEKKLLDRLQQMADEQNARQQAVYTARDIREAVEREDVLLSAIAKLRPLLSVPETGAELPCLICGVLKPWAAWQGGVAVCHDCRDARFSLQAAFAAIRRFQQERGRHDGPHDSDGSYCTRCEEAYVKAEAMLDDAAIAKVEGR